MTELLLYGIIGDPDDKLTSAIVTEMIRAGTGPLSVRINSPGGLVYEGLAIVQALREYPFKVTVHIDGLAASMASVIAMAGDEIIMAETSMMMIHRPWNSAVGPAEELRNEAARLDKLEGELVRIYAKQTGLSEHRISTMLAEETWMTAAEAIKLGFAHTIAEPLKIAACIVKDAYGFRNTPDQLREQSMPPINPPPTPAPTPSDPVAMERNRVTSIMAMASKHGIPAAAANQMIADGVTLEAARAAVLDYLAEQSDAANIGHNIRNHQSLDNPQTYGDAVRDALVAKISGVPATGPAAEFQGMGVPEIARDLLSRNGVRDVIRMSADKVINMAMAPAPRAQSGWAGFGGRADIGGMHTTSDFPDLIGAAAEKFMIERYKLQQSELKKLARRRDQKDFLTHYGIQLGSWGSLDQVNEAGEFKNRGLESRKEGYKIETFGNMFAVSRQMLVNDGMQALADILQIMAAGAAETEAALLAGIINANVILSDAKAWFSIDHGNLAPAGAPPTIASLDAGRLAMRSQKDIGGKGLIDARPKYLLVPVTLQTAAETLVASTIAPTTTADVNPFSGKLEPISDPRLASGTAWYLFADPDFSPGLQYSYLDGQENPFIDSREGWRTDGTEYKVRHDFGAGVMDYRMAWKNPGA